MKIMYKEWRKLSRAGRNKYFKRWKKSDRRKRRAVAFICPDCLRGFNAFEKCKIQKVFCGECGKAMIRRRGFFCELRPELKKCDYCGMCDTGTDADFDRYAVEVQNGYGYYDESGTYVSYGENAV